jgi:hypothetical protein
LATTVDYYTIGSFSGGTGGLGDGPITYSNSSTPGTSSSVKDDQFEINYLFGGSLAAPTSVSLPNSGTVVPLATSPSSFGSFTVTVTGTNPYDGSLSGVDFTLDVYQVTPGVVGSATLAATVSGEIVGGQSLDVNFSPSSTVSNSTPAIVYTVQNLDLTNGISGLNPLSATANVQTNVLLPSGDPVPLPSSGLMFLAMFGAVVSVAAIRRRVTA